jgi:pimeloyl-ACP methyl ester carboxylesterase
MTQAVETVMGQYIDVAGARLHYLEDGSGNPLVLLHQDIGQVGWLPFQEQLAQSFRVIAPELHGWGDSERASWMRSVRDLAVAQQSFLDKLGLENVTLVGLGLGGWVAAEMATMDQRRFRSLVLVGAAGLQPPEGEILDQFLLSYDGYVRRGFADQSKFDEIFGAEPETDMLVKWDISREMVARVAWKPYLFSQTLPYLLQDLRVPTLVVWGSEDGIVPISAGRRYAEAIPGARLEVVGGAGHFVEIEKPGEVARLVVDFAVKQGR